MIPFGDGKPHCKQCGYELDGRVGTCPRCQYRPQEKGFRVALGFLLVVVVMISVMMVLPSYGPILILIAGLAFLLSFVMLVVSFIATPSRLGGLFLRL